MYTIKKKGSENIPTITITDYIDPNGYCPKIVFSVTYSDEGFHVHYDAYEKNPKRVILPFVLVEGITRLIHP